MRRETNRISNGNPGNLSGYAENIVTSSGRSRIGAVHRF